MKIKSNKVRHIVYRDGELWIVTCPKCKKEVEIEFGNEPTCKCGYKWHIKIKGIGQK